MKKSLLLIATLLLIIALLPVLGNKFLQKSVDEQLKELSSSSFVIKKDETLSSYFKTQRHLEVNLYEKGDYLRVGFDITYYNLPFVKALKLTVYPLSFSKQTQKKLAESNAILYKDLDRLLQKKALLYHIEYNIINQKFHGYFQDIDENIHINKTTVLSIFTKKMKFSGHLGKNFFVDTLDTSLAEIILKFKQKKQLTVLELKKLKQQTSSLSKNQKITSKFSTSIARITIDSRGSSIIMKDLAFESVLKNVDEELYKQIQGYRNQGELKSLLFAMASKGLTLEMQKFQVKKIVLNKNKNLKGFSSYMKMNIKADPYLAAKIQISPLLILGNINFETKMKISNPVYEKLQESGSIHPLVMPYLKKGKSNVSLDFKYINSKIILNDKQLN